MVFRVYVDEAGGRAISGKSDRYFVVSAVIVHDEWNDQVRDELRALKAALGRQPHHLLHFRNLSRPKRLTAAQGVATFPIARLTSVIIAKGLIGSQSPAGNVAYIASPDPMYLWSLRLLLERVSWYIGGISTNKRKEAIVTASHVRGLEPRKLHDYRAALEHSQTRINWGLFAGHRFRVAGARSVDLLQVADIVASATFQAVEPGKDGPRYLRALLPAVYGYNAPGLVTSYGLKVFPNAEADPGGPLHWLRSL